MELARWSARTVHRFGTVEDAVDAVAMDLLATAERAVRLRGRAVMVLGTGPDCLAVYRRWVTLAVDRAFWPFVVVVLAEQTLSGPDAGRCLHLLSDALLTRVPILPEHCCVVDGSLPATAAAEAYERSVRMALELRARERPTFDRVVLGVAPDDRLSALALADWSAGAEAPLVHASGNGIVLSSRALASTERLLLLALGATRAEAVASWLGRRYEPARAALFVQGTPTACYTADAESPS